MITNPFLTDPVQALMTNTSAQFDKILENGVAGSPITFGAYTAVPLFITTFGIGVGGGSMLGEAIGGGGGGGLIPCAILIFGPDGVRLEQFSHEATSAASQSMATLVSQATSRNGRARTVGTTATADVSNTGAAEVAKATTGG